MSVNQDNTIDEESGDGCCLGCFVGVVIGFLFAYFLLG